MPDASLDSVRIAIPVCGERVSPVLDAAARLLLITRMGTVKNRKELVLTPVSATSFANWLAQLNVDVLLCAALSEDFWMTLHRAGVIVIPHLCGKIDAILRAFERGELDHDEFRMPGCSGSHAYQGLPARSLSQTLRSVPRRFGHR